ncbi:hypothetical protein DASC09_022460 [Saccharomycopsis crataegensis]|uniref:Transcription factor IIIC 90kDa subunit N-terminal domain-containing protein n=1 Tax=Saccharomycopsis crataegensis TaxID=43959 RepID=A0AAV5QJX1_9ASCO|nr:hypothetical protein DASC09_022460 [Saccharomycopsis crataegensis]
MKDILVKRTLPSVGKPAVDWSDEGKIAFACESTVTIVHLETLNSFETSFSPENIKLSKTEEIPQPINLDIISPDEKISAGAMNSDSQVISVFWSPSRFSADGYCYLAAITNDFNCVIYEQISDPIGIMWKQKFNLFHTLAHKFFDANAAKISQPIMNKARIASFVWSKPLKQNFSKHKLFAVGTESGHILVLSIVDDQLFLIFGKQVSTLRKCSNFVTSITWSDWTLKNDTHESYIFYVLPNNSLGYVRITSNLDKFEIKCSDDPVIFQNATKFKPEGPLRLVHTEKRGLVLFYLFAGFLKGYVVDIDKLFSVKLASIDQRSGFFVNEMNNVMTVKIVNSLIAFEDDENKNTWLFKVNFDVENGFHEPVIGKDVWPAFYDLVSRRVESSNDSSLKYFECLGICTSSFKESGCVLLKLFKPNLIDQRILAASTIHVNFIPMAAKTDTKMMDATDIDSWVAVGGPPVNFLMEKSILKQSYFKKLNITNKLLVNEYKDAVDNLSNFDPNSVQYKFSSEGTVVEIERNLDYVFYQHPVIKKLQMFCILLKRPKKPRYDDIKNMSAESKQKAEEEFEEDCQIFDTLHADIERKIMGSIGRLIVGLVKHFKVPLNNSFDQAIYYGALMVNMKYNNVPSPEIDESYIIPLEIYEGFELNFDFDYKKNSDTKWVETTDGLKFERCPTTLLPVLEKNVKHCEICGKQSLFMDHDADDSVKSASGSKLLRVITETLTNCIYCGGNLVKRP